MGLVSGLEKNSFVRATVAMASIQAGGSSEVTAWYIDCKCPRCRCACIGMAIHHYRNGIRSCHFTTDGATNGDVLTSFCGIDHPIGGDIAI